VAKPFNPAAAIPLDFLTRIGHIFFDPLGRPSIGSFNYISGYIVSMVDLLHISPALQAAYDPEQFRSQGHRLIDSLADELKRAMAGDRPVLPWRAPSETRNRWPLDARGGGDPIATLTSIAEQSTSLHHPGCAAHQVASPLPLAALAELVAALLNNGMAVYEMGPAAVPIEMAVISWLTRALGWPLSSGGCLTSGGSIGNLTALLAIRQLRGGGDAWRRGSHALPPMAVVTSSQAHYSISRALKIMGWGDAGVITAPVDKHYRLTGAAVETAVMEANHRGQAVVAIVASVGSTATGACDHLDEIADVAARHQLWLHVDGAHGASLAVSHDQSLRKRLAGIERADSVVWDAHKMLMMPALVTAVLFKDERHSYAAFAQKADYLFANGDAEDTWWDMGQRTVECTKRMMAIEMYVTLQTYGAPMFAEIVERQVALANYFAQLIDDADDFELALQPDLNIVCYRYLPQHSIHLVATALDELQRHLRMDLIAQGHNYIVGTTLETRYWLRSAFMNPMATKDDLENLVANIRRVGMARSNGMG
jgi:L-2,4-diaminobutyrate decarboxylase